MYIKLNPYTYSGLIACILQDIDELSANGRIVEWNVTCYDISQPNITQSIVNVGNNGPSRLHATIEGLDMDRSYSFTVTPRTSQGFNYTLIPKHIIVPSHIMSKIIDCLIVLIRHDLSTLKLKYILVPRSQSQFSQK